MVEHIAKLAGIKRGSRMLDIGCGYGGSSLHLAKHYGVDATGVTISSVQVDMANKAAAEQQVDAKFLLMDAEALRFSEPFDVLWSVDFISHYEDLGEVFCLGDKTPEDWGNVCVDGLVPQRGSFASGEKEVHRAH